MSGSIDALHLRRVWGRAWWQVPEPFRPGRLLHGCQG